MPSKKLLSGSPPERQQPESEKSLISANPTENSVAPVPNPETPHSPVPPLTPILDSLPDRIAAAMAADGLHIPADTEWQDWKAVYDSPDLFTRLYLAGDKIESVTDDLVQKNYQTIHAFWEDKKERARTETAYEAFYGPALSDALARLDEAFARLETTSDRQSYRDECNRTRLAAGRKAIDAALDLLLTNVPDVALTLDQLNDLTKRGSDAGLTDQEAREYIDNRKKERANKVRTARAAIDQFLSISKIMSTKILKEAVEEGVFAGLTHKEAQDYVNRYCPSASVLSGKRITVIALAFLLCFAILTTWLWIDSVTREQEENLRIASKEGNTAAVESLLTLGVAVNAPGAEGQTALIMAAAHGHLNIVMLLLNNGAKPDLTENTRQTALMYAAKEGFTAIVAILLSKGASVDLKDEDGQTALMKASEKGHLEIARTLLQHGANVILIDENGQTPFIKATGAGHRALADTLLAWSLLHFPPDPEEPGETPLIRVARNGQDVLVRALIERNPRSVNEKDHFGRTALMKAAEASFLPTTAILIRAQAVVDLRDKLGQTALMYTGNAGVAKLLLASGANPRMRNYADQGALHLAASNGYIDVLPVLLQHNLDIDDRDPKNRTPLFYAVDNGHENVVTLLLSEGANVHIRDAIYKTTPLGRAVYYGYPRIVSLLLKHGAKADFQELNKFTPLMVAAVKNHTEIVDTLLAHGANLDEVDIDGASALMKAAANGHKEIVARLLRHGADKNIRDRNGHTALDRVKNLAESRGDIIRLLEAPQTGQTP